MRNRKKSKPRARRTAPSGVLGALLVAGASGTMLALHKRALERRGVIEAQADEAWPESGEPTTRGIHAASAGCADNLWIVVWTDTSVTARGIPARPLIDGVVAKSARLGVPLGVQMLVSVPRITRSASGGLGDVYTTHAAVLVHGNADVVRRFAESTREALNAPPQRGEVRSPGRWTATDPVCYTAAIHGPRRWWESGEAAEQSMSRDEVPSVSRCEDPTGPSGHCRGVIPVVDVPVGDLVNLAVKGAFYGGLAYATWRGIKFATGLVTPMITIGAKP